MTTPFAMTNTARTQIAAKSARVFLDLTHLGRHVTGIERISIEQFEKVEFAGAQVTPIRSTGTLSLIFNQQIRLPLLALLHPSAKFVFPGFPPSPLFVFAKDRVHWYIHDLFLITRRIDLGLRAKLYMAAPFAFAVKRLTHFQVNSQKTAAELAPFVTKHAEIRLYRPSVANVFGLSADGRAGRPAQPRPLKIATLGTVEPRKNYAASLPILDALAKAGHPAHLHIIGREGWGEAKDALKGHPNVTIHGYLPAERVKALLEDADLYLCTSHDEGLGLPLLEAQYAGLSVIAPGKAVFREVLGTSAIFIDPSAPQDAAAKITAHLANPDWRACSTAAALANIARWNNLAAGDATQACQMFTRPAMSHTAV